MPVSIDLCDIKIHVVQKDVKNVHLTVLPPRGLVRITAPLYMDLESIRLFAISQLAWIKKQRQKMQDQEREAPRQFVDKESHYVWGQRYLLKRVEREAAPCVDLQRSRLVVQVRPGTGEVRSQEVLDAWYRDLIRAELPELIAKWESVLSVKVGKVFVQRMKTKWGSCNPASGAIRINTELAKKPPECLEYIVVHEMTHLLEPSHGERFSALMDLFLPSWSHVRRQLNQLPVRHEDWDY